MKVKRITIVLIISMFSAFAMGQTNYYSNQSSKNTNVFDYSTLPWTEAFDSLHACISLRYPYTQWKAIDWDSKNATTKPLIIEAQNANDTVLFVKELIEYLYDVPDGHISISGNLADFRSYYINGSYGFNMIQLDDGSVVVSYIPQESPAWEAGLRTGDKILKWNGIHIDSVGNLELLNYPRNYSTAEGRIFSKYLMLSRDSIGANSTITFQNNTSKQENTISLNAFDDDLEIYLVGFYNTGKPLDFDSLVQYKIIENNIGYLFIGAEMAQGETPEEIIQYPDFIKVKDAIAFFNDNNVDKLIVDLRFNLGGNDLQAAVTMGLFYEQASFYEYITASYDYDYQVIYELWTEPLTPIFNGEIAVIVDPNCISTGEGFAMMFQRLDNAKIISHCGTNGAFGMVDYDPVLLPEGLSVTFPQGRSLNANFVIQLDSDSTISGGVSPDIKVPLTVENVILQWQEGHDVQLEYAKSYLLDIEEILLKNNCLLFPNPCNDFVNLKLLSDVQNTYNVSLFNIQGHLVYYKQLNNTGKNQLYTLETIGLNSGMYFYCISNGIKKYQGKIIVKH